MDKTVSAFAPNLRPDLKNTYFWQMSRPATSIYVSDSVKKFVFGIPG